jgi:hypothetical protein
LAILGETRPDARMPMCAAITGRSARADARLGPVAGDAGSIVPSTGYGYDRLDVEFRAEPAGDRLHPTRAEQPLQAGDRAQ